MRYITVFFLAVLLFPTLLWGETTVNVPAGDPVYREIDRLVSFGLIKTALYAQRPWSRREIARLLGEIQGEVPPALQETVEKLKEEYGKEEGVFAIRPLERIEASTTFLDSPSREIPVSIGIGRIEADVNPLISYDEGRHYAEGHTLSLESRHRAKITDYFALQARPRLELLMPQTGTTEIKPIVQELDGKIAWKNLSLNIGRGTVAWGQGEFGGGLLSNNARPLDRIRFGSESPFFLPWLLRYMGPSHFNFVIANLGPEREFPRSFLLAGKGSIKPVTFFEFSVGQTLILGGEGAPETDVGDAFLDFWGIRTRSEGGNISSRLASVEGRLTLPSSLRHTQLYQEFIADDILKKSYAKTFEDRVYYTSGILIPRLDSDGTRDLRIEYRHFPGIAYRHLPFTTGWSLNRRLLGDELGPDGDGISISGNWRWKEAQELFWRTAYEVRDSDLYAFVSVGEDIIDDARVQDNPAEHRLRLIAGNRWAMNRSWEMEITGGYEHAWNFGFISGNDQDNFLLQVSVRLVPGTSR